ncbi:hypothetical protein BKG69_16990 [Mycobacteroides chelonae]|uniref:cupin domain-containing protein n=1 Tax=Mycobacteroides chelonae TaxID=1774 RepID=UPI0008A8DA50|nr:cupin domain-containing protein [Mycobacteroides chelonae]OHT78299.1 hypothetical protein BKG69_16990 [Mycobacteroides chelonae]
MSIQEIRMLGPGLGVPVVPDWGDDVSIGYTEVEWRSFVAPGGFYFGGTWEGEPGTVIVDPYPYDELCIMISGRVALIDLDGERREFVSGDAFFVPKSFRGVWETIEPSKKYFVALPGTQQREA